MAIESDDEHPAIEQLRRASELFTGTESEQREAMRLAVGAYSCLIRERDDVDYPMMLPLLRLEIALEDRDFGIADPLLKPLSPPRNRPATATWVWTLRCQLASAFVYRQELGESEGVAWATIQRDLSTGFTLQDVKSWKRQLENGKAGHRDGIHNAYWTGFAELRRRVLANDPETGLPCRSKEQREEFYHRNFVIMTKPLLNR